MLTTIWKSDIYIKNVVVVLVFLYVSSTWILIKRLEKNLHSVSIDSFRFFPLAILSIIHNSL